MTDKLAVRDDETRALPMTFDDMVRAGEKLVRTGFLPEYIKNGAQAAAIIKTGQELGMPMMRSLRSLKILKGKVIEDADSQLQRFKTDGGHAKFMVLSTTGATLWLKHPNGDEHTESFGEEDARRAGLLGNMYSKFPKAMYRSRAITAGLKSIGWEAGTYAPGELPEPAEQVRQIAPTTEHDADGVVLGPMQLTEHAAAEQVLAAIRDCPAGELAAVGKWIAAHGEDYFPEDLASFREAFSARKAPKPAAHPDTDPTDDAIRAPRPLTTEEQAALDADADDTREP
jgi:hypothetical protein